VPRLKPDTLRLRRAHILDAAERCFIRTGFHRTSMQDICKEASISPGALYLYFDSKEALIAGIAERDRNEFQERFAALATADDFMVALEALCRQYFVTEPAEKRRMCIEIGLEATRNAAVGEIFRGVDTLVRNSFVALFERLAAEGRICPALDIPRIADVCMTIGDGLFWRRATDPTFDAARVLPAVMGVIGGLINPVPTRLDAPQSRHLAPEATP
jgi:AcrR family transcriptional regulator